MKFLIITDTAELDDALKAIDAEIYILRDYVSQDNALDSLDAIGEAVDVIRDAIADTYYIFQCSVCGQKHATTKRDLDMMLKPCSECMKHYTGWNYKMDGSKEKEEKPPENSLVFIGITKMRSDELVQGAITHGAF